MRFEIFLCLFVCAFVCTSVDGIETFRPSNYDLSRNQKLGSRAYSTNYEISRHKGLGNNHHYPHYPGGNYPGHGPGLYPSGPGNYPGQYPGSNYPAHHPGSHYPDHHHPGLVGPPGAHPGCPLCDSSVYSYCSHKQDHDSCCCENSFLSFGCRNADCKFLYANSCEEYQLITDCCCVDLEKSNAIPVGPVAPAAIVV